MKKNNMAEPAVESGVYKIFRIMKLSVFLTLICVIQAFAGKSFSQNTSLTLELRNTSIEDVLFNIEEQSRYVFLYNKDMIDVKRKVDVQLRDANIDEALKYIFNGTGVKYRIIGKQIALSPEYSEQQQVIKVSGKVTEASGAPLPGVTVLVKSTSNGIVTDMDGNYTLGKVPGDATLIFSFIGMKSQEIPVAGKTAINVVMQEDVESLDEIVVTGYGNFKKASFTGSANTVNAEKIKDIPVVSIEQKLQGQTAGVFIASNSGQPAALPEVRIRGMGSFSATNQPLYVIDGVPVSTGSMSNTAGYMTQSKTSVMATINPNDIENITVIKDAAAASLYGSRAANGVILITTKKGKAGATKVDLTISGGLSDLAVDYRPTCSGEERRELIYEALYNGAVDKGESDPEAYAASLIETYAPKPWSGYTDWKDYLLRKHAYSQNYEASVSGGDDKSKFLASIGWMSQEGMAINSDFQRYSGNLNYERKISNKIEFSGKIMLSQIEQNLNEERGTLAGPYFLLPAYITPSEYPYNEDGTYNRTNWIHTSGEGNVVETMKNDIARARITRMMTNASLSYEIIDGLKLKESLNYDYTIQKDKQYFCPYSFAGQHATQGIAETYKSFTEFTRVFSSTSLSFVKKFNEAHNIDALVAFETEDFNKDELYAKKTTIASEHMTDLSAASVLSSASSSPSEYRLISYVSRLNYDYKGKYYLGASFRRDGTSRLNEDNRWGNFWSVSGMWRLTEESFLEGIKGTFTDLKLRASYGVNGNLPNSYYAYQGLYSYTMTYMGNLGSYESSLNNENLKWEKNYNMNIGLDFTLYDRVSVTAEYYSRQTKDLLYSMPLSYSSGFASRTTNIGHISNTGFELEFNTTNIDKGDFLWTTNLSFAHNKNEIKKINDVKDHTIAANRINMYIRKVGGPFYEFYLKEFAGVNPENGKVQYYLNTEKDGTLDKTITENAKDAQAVDVGKHAMPKLTSNMTNTLYYRNFDLSFNFIGSWGGYTFDYMANYAETDGTNPKRNFPKYYMNRWQKAGDKTDIPRLSTAIDSNNRPSNTTRYLHSNDYIRLKSLTFGYTMPNRITKKAYMSKVRLYFSGSNLFTHAAWDNYDPETEMGGFTWASAPVTKNFTIGANITF